MKLEKKHWVIIGVVIAVIVIWYFFFKKKPAESNYRAIRWCPRGYYSGPTGKCMPVIPDPAPPVSSVLGYVSPVLMPLTESVGVGTMMPRTMTLAKIGGNPLTTCIDRCTAQGFPREKCIYDCTGGPANATT